MLRPDDVLTARKSLLFRTLPPAEASRALERAAVLALQPRETLFLQGDPAERIFVALDGWVKIIRDTRGGAEAVVSVFTSGQSFAEAPGLLGVAYPVGAEAATVSRVLALEAAPLRARMDDSPALSRAVIAATYRHMHGLVEQVEQLKARTGAQRLAEFLLDLAGASHGATEVRLPYDKVLVAGRLGMSPESLSRAFVRLKTAGVEVAKDRARISDMAALQAFVDLDRGGVWRQER